MSRRTRKIIFFSVMGIVLAGLITGIVLLVNHITRNPFEGTWNSTDTRASYTFYEDGSVKIYYPGDKLPVLETNYNGSVEGTYAYDKSEKEVSITIKIYSKEITSHYTYDIKENTLTLNSTTDDTSKTYSKVIVEN